VEAAHGICAVTGKIIMVEAIAEGEAVAAAKRQKFAHE